MAHKKKKSFYKKNQKPEKKSQHPEVRGLIMISWCILLLLSLFSFTYGDASTNWLGYLGYAAAYICNYLFGLSSYVICLCLIGFGWKQICHKQFEQKGLKILYFSIMIFSLSVLLNVIAESFPNAMQNIGSHVYSETVITSTPTPYRIERYYLGGVPTYYLYMDLPNLNLYKLLSNVGVSLVFFTIFFTATLLFAEIRIAPFLRYIHRLILKLSEQRSRDKFIHFMKGFLTKTRPPKTPEKGAPLRAHALGIKSELRPQRHQNLKLKSSKEPSLKEEEFTLSPRLGSKLKPSSEELKIHHPMDMEEPVSKLNPPLKPQSLEDQSPVFKREQAFKAQKVYNGDFEHYEIPSTSLLTDPKPTNHPSLKKDLRKQAEILEETLLSFGIEAKVGEIHCGPTITSFEVQPAIGVKVQRIKALENDIALNMEAKSIRIIAPIPGKAAVGIEVPTIQPQEVNFKDMLLNYHRKGSRFHIPILLGKTVSGENVMADLAKMPHCIIAGATGTGKSVCINAFVMSILMNCRPDEVKLILVDPKKVELTPYTNLPHMLAPVITEPVGVIEALKWLVREMEKRYEILKVFGVRNIATYNSRKIDPNFEKSLNIEAPKRMNYIVCIIDELADLMMMSSNEIEMPIARIAQMARAVGIHLVLATQRPSREVITGLIKANFPTRLSFKVASRVNSQIVLDEIGAESLLGNGDMLFHPPGSSNLVRTQGCYIRDQDIHKVVDFICNQAPPNYLIDSFDVLGKESEKDTQEKVSDSPKDALYEQALDLVKRTGAISTTFIQRKLKIGYARAASIMDQLEENGIISPPDGSKPRRLLLSPKDLSLEDDL